MTDFLGETNRYQTVPSRDRKASILLFLFHTSKQIVKKMDYMGMNTLLQNNTTIPYNDTLALPGYLQFKKSTLSRFQKNTGTNNFPVEILLHV